MMKHIVIALVLLLVGITQINAQVMDAPTGFEDVQVSSAPRELDIQIKAMIPDISVVQIKRDTYAEPGNYKYTVDLEVIQQESRTQLTNWQQEIYKWLEESK